MTWQRVFLNVTLAALLGMVMGGLFGAAAGTFAPDFFVRQPHSAAPQLGEPGDKHSEEGIAELRALFVAAMLGGTAGVLLGGGLGCFGILIETLDGRHRREGRRLPEGSGGSHGSPGP